MKHLSLLYFIIFATVFSLSGCSHKHYWTEPSCSGPQTCASCGIIKADPLNHTWLDATCESPKRCANCDKTEGEALSHSWIEATCEAPMKCSICYLESGPKADHNWTEETEDSPSECIYCDEMKPLSLPESGHVFIGSNLRRGSELSIESSTTKSCYIKLKDVAGSDVLSFFVRAGDSITVAVPRGSYYVYFSYGNDWYGTEHLFGDITTYAKDDEIRDFENYTWSYKLYPTFNGNFSETPVDEEEFK